MKTNLFKQLLTAIPFVITGFVNAQKFPLTVGVSSTNTTCENYNDGSITLTVYGGVQPYTYLWSNGATSQSVVNLSPGFYDVMVRDANTAISITVEIRNTSNINIQGSITNASTFGADDGGIDVQLSGISGNFNFNWISTNGNYVNNGALDQVNLHAGTYTLTVVNENGCESSESFLVEQPNPVLNPHNAISNDFVGHEFNVKGLIYPNPSNGALNFKSMEEVNSIDIYNLEGNLVKKLYSIEGNIDAIDLDKGTYKAMIQTIDGKITTDTIIVK